MHRYEHSEPKETGPNPIDSLFKEQEREFRIQEERGYKISGVITPKNIILGQE